jgi:hypothetical protein
MKSRIAVFVLSLFQVASVWGLTNVRALSLSADLESYVAVVDTNGSPIPSGAGYVAVGRFSADPSGMELFEIAADFTPLVFGSMGGAALLNAAGTFDVQWNGTLPAAYIGEQAYVVIGDGSDLVSSTSIIVVDGNATFSAADLAIYLENTVLIHGAAHAPVEIAELKEFGLVADNAVQLPFLTAGTTVEIALITKDASGVRLELVAMAGGAGVEYSPDMADGSWTDIGDFGLTGVFLDTNAARVNAQVGFYRAFLR